VLKRKFLFFKRTFFERTFVKIKTLIFGYSIEVLLSCSCFLGLNKKSAGVISQKILFEKYKSLSEDDRASYFARFCQIF